MCLFLAVLGPHSCADFSVVAASRGHSRCGVRASPRGHVPRCGARAPGCGGFSSCGFWALEHRRRSCGKQAQLLCGMWIFPDQGSNPCVLHWQADAIPLDHQGNPLIAFKEIVYYILFQIFVNEKRMKVYSLCQTKDAEELRMCHCSDRQSQCQCLSANVDCRCFKQAPRMSVGLPQRRCLPYPRPHGRYLNHESAGLQNEAHAFWRMFLFSPGQLL